MPDAPASLTTIEGDDRTIDGVKIIGRIICEKGTPNLAKVQFRLLAGRHTTVGRVLGVQASRPSGQPILTLIRVQSLWEHNPHEDALGSTVSEVIPFETKYAREGLSTVIYRAADAETLEEALLESDGSIKKIESVETLLLSGSPVIEVPPDLISRALNLAPTPDGGFDMGTLHGLPAVRAILRRDAIQTHIFIAGGIGRGKSYARRDLAEELAAHGIPQINIDPMGELVEATESLGGLNVQPGKGFSLPLSALESGDVIDAIPAINRGTNIETLVAYAHESLLREKVLKKGEHFGVEELVNHIEKIAPDLKLDDARTLMPAKMRVRSLERIDYIGAPYPWADAIKPGTIINIDCRTRLTSELRLITASVARDIQRLAKARKIPFVVFSIDEAHLIAPNNSDIVTTQVLREIARIGRHYRIGLVLTTQSPADMDRAVLKRLLTRFIFAIEPDQLESLRGVFADAPEAIVNHLPKLPVGTCLLTGVSETIRHAAVVDIRRSNTPDGGRTPDIFSDLAKRGWDGRRPLEKLIKKNEKEA